MQRIGALALFTLILGAFSAHADDSFEAVSIKPYPEGTPIRMSGCQGGPGGDDPARINCEYTTLRMLLRRAYDAKASEIFGPGVLDSEHFNIVAKVPAGATKDQVPAMFRNLLAERFKVTLHREERMLPGYSLEVAKSGLKMKESTTPAAPTDDSPPASGPPPIGEDGFPILRKSLLTSGPIIFFREGRARLEASQATVSALAAALSNQLDRVVVDDTGLSGKYEIVVTWTPETNEIGARPRDPQDGAALPETSLFGALEQQLGLRLVSEKIKRNAIVVDRVEKVPTEN